MPTLVPKHIMGMSGDSPAGKPSDAIGYVGEGAFFLSGTQYSEAKFPISEELLAKGLTAEQWAAVCKSLSAGKGKLGMSYGFSQAIAAANSEYFYPIGCVACYAEYGKGQKAMVVFTTEVAAAGRVKFAVPTLSPKHIMGMSGDSPAGAPEGAIGYVGEGAFFLSGTQYSEDKFPLSAELQEMGMTADEWAAVCATLRKGKGYTGIGGGFSAAIKAANETYFAKLGCVACYAEYGQGQKAMVVFTTAAAEGRVAMEALPHSPLKAAFDAYDADGSGKISMAELSEALTKGGKTVTDEELEALIAEIDKDGDKELDFEEFETVFQKAPESLPLGVKQLAEMTTSLFGLVGYGGK